MTVHLGFLNAIRWVINYHLCVQVVSYWLIQPCLSSVSILLAKYGLHRGYYGLLIWCKTHINSTLIEEIGYALEYGKQITDPICCDRTYYFHLAHLQQTKEYYELYCKGIIFCPAFRLRHTSRPCFMLSYSRSPRCRCKCAIWRLTANPVLAWGTLTVAGVSWRAGKHHTYAHTCAHMHSYRGVQSLHPLLYLNIFLAQHLVRFLKLMLNHLFQSNIIGCVPLIDSVSCFVYNN